MAQGRLDHWTSLREQEPGRSCGTRMCAHSRVVSKVVWEDSYTELTTSAGEMIASSIAWTENVCDAGVCSSADDPRLVLLELPLSFADFSEGGEDSVKDGA